METTKKSQKTQKNNETDLVLELLKQILEELKKLNKEKGLTSEDLIKW